MGGPNVWIAEWPVTKDLEQRANELGPLRVQARSAAMQVRATIEARQVQLEAQEANIELIRQTQQTAIGTRELADATGALVDQTSRLVRSTIWVAVFTDSVKYRRAGCYVMLRRVA